MSAASTTTTTTTSNNEFGLSNEQKERLNEMLFETNVLVNRLQDLLAMPYGMKRSRASSTSATTPTKKQNIEDSELWKELGKIPELMRRIGEFRTSDHRQYPVVKHVKQSN